MEWNEYVSYLLSSVNDFNDLTISLDEGHSYCAIPPLIGASITMLDKMIEHQGRLNLLVFPERSQSIFVFILMKLFHNITMGKIGSSYDPSKFIPGERLKVGKAIVEYVGVEEREGALCLIIKTGDEVKSSMPLKYLPVFQRVSTKRKLSKYAQYAAARKIATASLFEDTSGKEKLSYVADMKTHMNSSVFAITSIAGAKEQLSKCYIDGMKVTDIFYIAQSNYEGKLNNISSGQMTGTPAIVFASDLYAVNAAAERCFPIQSLIIDGSNMNSLLGQLDVLDELIRLNIPIVCVTDTVNSFELEQFSLRHFNIWRWDHDSLTSQLYDRIPLSSDKRIKNCAKQSVTYMRTNGEEISSAMKRLAAHRKDSEEQSPKMMRLFEKLNSLTFAALRTTIPFTENEKEYAQRILNECEIILKDEKPFIGDLAINDFSEVIGFLRVVYASGFFIKKEEMLKNYLQECSEKNVYLVIPEKSQKVQIQAYWDRWCMQHFLKTHITVLFPSEYYAWPFDGTDVTIICGWLKRAIMRKIIYSYNTSQYIVLLYDYESRWQKYDSHRWSKSLNNLENKEIIEKSLSTDMIRVSTVRYEQHEEPETPSDSDVNTDEQGEIELILRKNKYRQYINGGTHSANSVGAIPVNFVGGFLAFYSLGHKVVSATKIITLDADKIETKLPTELQVGDFIVVRETDRDLVREIADVVLANSGKQELRTVATKWREALKIELLFCSEDKLCEKIQAAGCNKEISTIKHWIYDDDVIAPQSKEDMAILASVTENETLIEKLDSIFEAAQEVRKAHVLAGRKLSEQLKRTIADELKKFENIDPFNLWEPLEIEVEGIGNVRVLKIIDIGSEIQVDSADTNRLIEE